MEGGREGGRVFVAFLPAANEKLFDQLVQDKVLTVAKSSGQSLPRVLKTATLSTTLRGGVNLVDAGVRIPPIGIEAIAPHSLFIRAFVRRLAGSGARSTSQVIFPVLLLVEDAEHQN